MIHKFVIKSKNVMILICSFYINFFKFNLQNLFHNFINHFDSEKLVQSDELMYTLLEIIKKNHNSECIFCMIMIIFLKVLIVFLMIFLIFSMSNDEFIIAYLDSYKSEIQMTFN